MQYVAAAALANLSGKVDAILKAIVNKKVDELISKGLSKVSLGAPAGGSSAPAPAAEKKKE